MKVNIPLYNRENGNKRYYGWSRKTGLLIGGASCKMAPKHVKYMKYWRFPRMAKCWVDILITRRVRFLGFVFPLFNKCNLRRDSWKHCEIIQGKFLSETLYEGWGFHWLKLKIFYFVIGSMKVRITIIYFVKFL